MSRRGPPLDRDHGSPLPTLHPHYIWINQNSTEFKGQTVVGTERREKKGREGVWILAETPWTLGQFHWGSSHREQL